MAIATTTRLRDVGAQQASSSRFSVEEIPTATGARHCLPCGACSCCADVCGDRSCLHCECESQSSTNSSTSTSTNPSTGSLGACAGDNNKMNYYTMCQIRRHGTAQSAWLVVGDDIYDATSYISSHPGGKNSILKKAGGCCDCVEDFNFHSRTGRQMWRKYHVGKVRKCPSQGALPEDRQWWMFWM